MVAHLLLSYAAAISQETKSTARAPWCARGRGCVSLILGPPHGALQVPLEKLRRGGASVGEMAVGLLVSVLVYSLTSKFMALLGASAFLLSLVGRQDTMHSYWPLLRDLLLTKTLVFVLLFSYVAAINRELVPRARAPWCARGPGCASLLLGPVHDAVYVPLGKYRPGGPLEEAVVTLIVSLLVASTVTTFTVVVLR
ncbi:hypothetical protein KFL_000670120 [Klebsormidium nitens]|uniref:Uncharacterized protein n=1 Tax=Klebsormidium nitens TaxID=105231 RepID=A0A1Y1HQN8_KLENI|nr:hypothetical protein KFL_000670120 [Klebsormidium nitens]|eukprot:GAQ80954.1 hypothetical protein KFL_000670120 [Klebsormidium nitens]